LKLLIGSPLCMPVKSLKQEQNETFSTGLNIRIQKVYYIRCRALIAKRSNSSRLTGHHLIYSQLHKVVPLQHAVLLPWRCVINYIPFIQGYRRRTEWTAGCRMNGRNNFWRKQPENKGEKQGCKRGVL